ncbi:DUF7351 domain-containing protein [Haloarchaeobius sp. DT45]|uniref:DUF7351 domain-containing protein n=1 Tax=Haloarchaeobius sp. DT45 TaxID=3446116 RepID=UPI003F6D2B60
MTAPAVERRPPEAVFAQLGNELRIRIIQTLGSADSPLAFSEIRGHVEERDSGKFNYHLKKLVGSFVRRVEPDETAGSEDDTLGVDGGYELSLAGEQVYGAMLAGTYTATGTLDSFDIEGVCPVCRDETLRASYENEQATVACSDCDAVLVEAAFPPATLDQFEREELPHAFDTWARASLARVLSGFCNTCGGRVTGRLFETDGSWEPVRAEFTCGYCGNETLTSASLPMSYHHETTQFLADHGVDVQQDPSWTWHDPDDEHEIRTVSRDPLRVEVVVSRHDERLVATIDETVRIVATRREAR